MTIVIINTLYPPNRIGGAEKSVKLLAEGLVKNGHSVSVITTSNKIGIDKSTINGVDVYNLGLKNLYWPYDGSDHRTFLKPFFHALDAYNLLMAKQVGRLIDRIKPDLVHTHNLDGLSTAVWNKVNKSNIPLIHTLRDYSLLCPNCTMYKRNRNCNRQCLTCKLFVPFNKALSQKVIAVTGISQFILRRHLDHGHFQDSIYKEVIYNFCEEGIGIHPTDEYSKNVLTIGYLGRITKAKGIEFLLERMSQIDGNWKLLVGGSGNQKYLQKLTDTYNDSRIQFLGFVDQKQLLSSVDILVVPSLMHESFGRVVIEAYSYSVPVLVSNRGGLPEIVQNTKTGYIFDPNKPEMFDKIIDLIKNDRKLLKELGYNARKYVESFTYDKGVKKYEALYTKILSQTD